jgi:hypothetical protein
VSCVDETASDRGREDVLMSRLAVMLERASDCVLDVGGAKTGVRDRFGAAVPGAHPGGVDSGCERDEEARLGCLLKGSMCAV